MLVQYTRYKIGENRRKAFIEAHQQALRNLQFRCIHYELTPCSDECDWYTLRIEWDLTEQLLRFRSDPAGKVFRQAISGFERKVEEEREWEATDVVYSSMPPEIAQILSLLPDRPPWNGLCSWILERLSQRILVEEMAARVNMSPRNFALVLRREFRMSPGGFIDRVRVAAANLEQKGS